MRIFLVRWQIYDKSLIIYQALAIESSLVKAKLKKYFR